MDYFRSCPISHVPVAVCRSVGIRTRGRTAASGRRYYFLAPATGSRRRTGDASSPLATRLKATTEGIFWLTTRANAGDTERACPSLPAVRNGVSLIRTKAAITVTQRIRNPAERRASQEVHLGGYAVGRIRELVRNDHTHPRISQASH